MLISIDISFLGTCSIVSFNDQFQVILLQEDDFFSDDSDSDDQIMRRLVAAANRSRLVQRQERNRSPGAGPSDVLDINSSIHVSGVQTISPSSGPASGVTSTFNSQPPVSNTTSESANRPNTYEMFSFPESFKSKFSAASTR